MTTSNYSLDSQSNHLTYPEARHKIFGMTYLHFCNHSDLQSTSLSVSYLHGLVRAIPLLMLLSIALCGRAQNVTTWHNDNSRSGVQPAEAILTTSNVNSTTFGKVFSFPVLGSVYAQPLYISQYMMADGNLHNVLIVATQEDYVYAFDADGNNPAQGYLWSQSLLGPGETWVSSGDVGVNDIYPSVGITGTPVVDPVGGIIYVVAKSKNASGTKTFYQRLHALNVADGTEKLNGPTLIAATVPGTGDGSTTISFNPLLNNQRAALMLAPTPGVGSGNSVFIAWASHGDLGMYHGWVIAYDAANIATQNAVWMDTPNGAQGGIWMCGGGLSTDGAGNIYIVDGNGTFDASSGGSDYGDSAVRMTLGQSGPVVADYFTPDDQKTLDIDDRDMGTAAPLLLPTQTGGLPNLLVTADKGGIIYLINRDKMGGYTTRDNSSVQSFGNGGYLSDASFAFLNNTLYYAPDRAPLQAWAFDPTTELFSTTPVSQSPTVLGCSSCSLSGSTPSISAMGTSQAIVWALDNGKYNEAPAILHAYDATNLASELYNSTQAANGRDAAANAIKFTTPTIANGRVYVGGRNGVTAYGLLSGPLVTATPNISPAGGTLVGTQTVSITDSTYKASIFYTTDGTLPTAKSTPYMGAIQVSNSETIQAIATAPGLSQSALATATFTILPPPPPPAPNPQFSPPAGTYNSPQSVTITDAAADPSIYFTTNGTAATTSSKPYTKAVYVTSSGTINAIATASGYSQSSNVSAHYVIQLPGTITEVPLSAAANTIGIYTDGSKVSGGGVNGDGDAYSGAILGSSLTYAGVPFSFGIADTKNVVRGTKAPVITLPAYRFSSLEFLGAAVVKNQKSVVFKVTYTDGTSTKYTQSLSDWTTPQHYTGETIALTSSYVDTDAGGRLNKSHYLFEYSLPLNSSKVVKSLTLPSNSDVVVVSVTMVPIA